MKYKIKTVETTLKDTLLEIITKCSAEQAADNIENIIIALIKDKKEITIKIITNL